MEPESEFFQTTSPVLASKHARSRLRQPVEYRVLPYVWRRLDALGYDLDDQRLRGIYKRTWVFNQQLLSAAAGMQQELRSHGVHRCCSKAVAC